MDIAKLTRLIDVNPLILEEKFRSREVRGRVVSPFIVRLDGVGFSKALKGFREPRDHYVHEALVKAASQIVERYGLIGAYIVSDEVNLVVYPQAPYNGREEKITSIFSGILSSKVSLILNRQLFFDARIIVLYDLAEAIEYILYRARVGLGNYIGSMARRLGLWVKKRPRIHEQLKGLEAKGIRVDSIPEWELVGSSITWTTIWVEKVNPQTKEKIKVKRRRIQVTMGPWMLIETLDKLLRYSPQPSTS